MIVLPELEAMTPVDEKCELDDTLNGAYGSKKRELDA